MIGIQINNINQKRQEYTDAIADLVAFRVSVLQESLSHLNGDVVDFSTGNFVSFKAVTKQIIDIVGDNINIPNGRNGYTNSINNYRANPNGLVNLNIAGLLQLCQYLLTNNNQQLFNLLVCESTNLMTLCVDILNNYAINTPPNIDVIKTAFNYQKYEDVATAIKAFFRANIFARVCPYCNIEPVVHHTNNALQVVRSFELDHFYDKSRYPLLSYSFSNLVPSDHTCNVTNKGVTEFTDDYHLNPHSTGYEDRITFIPIGLTTAYTVSRVDVNVLEVPGTAIYRRINGNNQPNEEQGNLGNLNVFRIRSKYSDETHRVGHILKTVHKENKHFKHLKKYFKALNTLDRKANYIKWYEKELNVRFNVTDFNDKAFSKLCRDIHDYYFDLNRTIWNRYIIELIA